LINRRESEDKLNLIKRRESEDKLHLIKRRDEDKLHLIKENIKKSPKKKVIQSRRIQTDINEKYEILNSENRIINSINKNLDEKLDLIR